MEQNDKTQGPPGLDPYEGSSPSSTPQPSQIISPAASSQPVEAPDHLQNSVQNPPPKDGIYNLPVGPYSSISSSSSNSGKFKKLRSKKVILSAASGLLLVLGAGYVFGLYIPNRPQNVWNTGLDRTGEVTEKLLLQAVEDEKIAAIKKSQLTGSLQFESDDGSYSVSIDSKYDTKYSDSSLDAKYKQAGSPEQSVGLKVLTDLPDKAYFPDIYFQLTGIKALGVDAFLPGASQYEGKWISVSSKYLSSFLPEDAKKEKRDDFTHEDGAELARIITAKTREYVLTSKPEKAVIIQKEFVGTEKMEDGLAANHYKAGINKGNAKKYCQELIESVMSSKAYKKLLGKDSDSSTEEDKKSSVKSCHESIDKDFDEDETYDLWIDKKYKLIHKLRFSDKEDKGSYLEIGQNYKGGDEVPFFLIFHSDKEKYHSRLTLNLDTKASTTKGEFKFDQEGENKYKIAAEFQLKSYDNDLTVKPPAGAVPIQEVMKKLGFESDIGAVSNSADDTERKTDLRLIHSKLAEYYAVNGYYPDLNEVNSAAWRGSLSSENFKDPAGSDTALAARPAKNRYSYSPAGCTGSQCQSYTLTAVLSDGSPYTLNSL